MTVNAYDSETRQPISNVVVEIDGRQVATNPGGELTHTFEPRRRVVGRQSELVSTAVMITRAPKYAAVTNTINLMVPRLRVQAVYDKGKADGKTPIPLVIRAEDAESNQPVQGRIFIDGVATQLVTNQTVMYPVPVVRRLLIGRPRGTGDQIAVNPLVNWWVVADNGHYSDTRVVSPSDD